MYKRHYTNEGVLSQKKKDKVFLMSPDLWVKECISLEPFSRDVYILVP